MAQLGGALRQWSARPENLGARGEVLRVLSVFLESARQEEVLPLWAQADALRDVIEMLDSETLQADHMAPLLVHFESLKRAIETFSAQST
jgi:chemosensory pili system protein ChpA (sensor histidine kinase/response regulator)